MEQQFYVRAPNGYRIAGKEEVLDAAAQWTIDKVPSGKEIKSTDEAVEHIRLTLAARDSEAFVALWLDLTGRPISLDVIAKGDLTEVTTRPRDLMRMALERNAAAVIVAHNHPGSSGVAPNASDADIKNGLQLGRLLGAIGVRLLDAVVINKKGYYSIFHDDELSTRVERMVREEEKRNSLSEMFREMMERRT